MDRNESDTLLMPEARAEGFEEFMALIEIPNIYNSDTAVGRGRFAVIGEPIVAVDLINTVAAPPGKRSMTAVPSSRSMATIWCDRAGCDMCSIAAARVSEPCSTMETRHSSALIENISATLPLMQRAPRPVRLSL